MSGALDKKKVILGISGGVDSTTAALLLEKQGFEVSGLYFDITGKNEEGREAAKNALKAAGARGQFYYVDARENFENIVIRNFIEEYTLGHTPNPCVLCNPRIKFKYLIDKANEVGAYYIATGHYADVHRAEDGHCYIRAVESKKDQSYMLCGLSQEVLTRLILPLSEVTDKEVVRKLAKEANLPSAETKDSQEICFIDDIVGYAEYIRLYGENTNDIELKQQIKRALTPGNFVDNDFNVLGQHKGILNYTIGQRKGLGIALGKPCFVTQLLGERNEVVLGENQELFNRNVMAINPFFTGKKPAAGDRLSAKIRYAAKKSDCEVVSIDDNKIILRFDEPQRAPTNGQQLVIYENDLVLGGGTIG